MAARRTAQIITVLLVAVIVALLAFMIISGVLTGTLTLGKVLPAVSLLTIVLVTGVVGLVVAGHQPRNPIGWLLAGEAVFILLSVAGGGREPGVPARHHDLAFAGPLALVLDQLFNYLLLGFPLVILLFPDGRLPSRRWRPVVGIYLAVAAAAVLATSAAVLILVAGHHVGYQPSGNLASLGHWGTAWVIPVQVVLLIIVGAFWLAAITRQALSWRRSDGERRQQLTWLASGAAVCGVFGIWAIATNSAIWEVLILGLTALPLSIGLRILKYRLYDIDRTISRTLAYAIVTGLLVGVYTGLVLLATGVLGFHSTVAVAAATLAAAGTVQSSAATGAAAGGPAVQPSPVRRRPDGGRFRGAAERHRGYGFDPRRLGQCRAPGAGTGPRVGVDRRSRQPLIWRMAFLVPTRPVSSLAAWCP